MTITCLNNELIWQTIDTDNYVSSNDRSTIIGLRIAQNKVDVMKVFKDGNILELGERTTYLLLAMGASTVSLYTDSVYDQLLEIFLNTMDEWKFSIQLSMLTHGCEDPYLKYMPEHLSQMFQNVPKFI